MSEELVRTRDYTRKDGVIVPGELLHDLEVAALAEGIYTDVPAPDRLRRLAELHIHRTSPIRLPVNHPDYYPRYQGQWDDNPEFLRREWELYEGRLRGYCENCLGSGKLYAPTRRPDPDGERGKSYHKVKHSPASDGVSIPRALVAYMCPVCHGSQKSTEAELSENTGLEDTAVASIRSGPHWKYGIEGRAPYDRVVRTCEEALEENTRARGWFTLVGHKGIGKTSALEHIVGIHAMQNIPALYLPVDRLIEDSIRHGDGERVPPMIYRASRVVVLALDQPGWGMEVSGYKGSQALQWLKWLLSRRHERRDSNLTVIAENLDYWERRAESELRVFYDRMEGGTVAISKVAGLRSELGTVWED